MNVTGYLAPAHRLFAAIMAVLLLASMGIGCGSPMRSVKTPPSSPVPADATATVQKVPAGTQVPVSVLHPLSSRDTDSTYGETVRHAGFVVAEDVRGQAGVVLIARGTPVVADVTRKIHERLGREGRLTIRLVSTKSTSGAAVKLDERPHRFTGRKRLAGVIVGSILLFPIGLLFLLLQGGDVTLESGSGLTATVVE